VDGETAEELDDVGGEVVKVVSEERHGGGAGARARRARGRRLPGS
jgi:hypothetical protein